MLDPADALVLSVCLSPGIQRTMVLGELARDEVNRIRQVHLDAGGKGAHVARVLRQLGVPVKLVTHGGQNQQEYSDLLDHDSFPYTLVSAPGRIRHNVTLLEGDIPPTGDLPDDLRIKAVTELVEPSDAVGPSTQEEVLRTVAAGIAGASVLSLSGSMAPGYDITFFADLVALAREAGVYTLLDVRGSELLHAFSQEPHMVKINLDEFARTFLPEKAGFIEHCETLHQEGHADMVRESLMDVTEDTGTTVIVTRGPRTIWFAHQGDFGTFDLPVIHRSRIKNPTGSGDAFTAGLAAWLHGHMSPRHHHDGLSVGELEEAMALGVRCAQENARLIRPGRIR